MRPLGGLLLAAITGLAAGYLLRRWVTVRGATGKPDARQSNRQGLRDRSSERSQTGIEWRVARGTGSHPAKSDVREASSPERRAEPDPEALSAGKAGPDRIGFDLEQLRSGAAAYEPLIEHLTYIQVKRGEQESLIFVRRRDLDTLAALTGMSKEDFVEQFQQLGVMISQN